MGTVTCPLVRPDSCQEVVVMRLPRVDYCSNEVVRKHGYMSVYFGREGEGERLWQGIRSALNGHVAESLGF